MAGGLVSACLYPAKDVPLFQHDGRWSWRDRRISSQFMMISSTTTTRQLMAPVAARDNRRGLSWSSLAPRCYYYRLVDSSSSPLHLISLSLTVAAGSQSGWRMARWRCDTRWPHPLRAVPCDTSGAVLYRGFSASIVW